MVLDPEQTEDKFAAWKAGVATQNDPDAVFDEDTGEALHFIPAGAAQDLGVLPSHGPAPLVASTGFDTGKFGAWAAGVKSRTSLNPDGIAGPSIITGVYMPIPLDELLLEQRAYELLNSLDMAETNIWVKNDILNSIDAMELAPEVAHVLRNSDFIDEWQNAAWPYVLDAMVNGDNDANTHLGVFEKKDLSADQQVKEFFQMFGGAFSSGEKELIMQVFASIPSTEDLMATALNEGRVTLHRPADDSVLNRAWSALATFGQTAWNAPEVLDAMRGDP